MADEKPKAHDLTTEQVVKHLFPKEAREAVALEARKGRKAPVTADESTEEDSS
jgi:hypothetical protein